MDLDPTEKRKPHWQIAAGELVLAAELDGIVTRAEIAMRCELAHGKPPATPRNKVAKKC